jgi:glyoxylase-like metal-dependent hydrolase (beta-lactamase superfamily II)
VSGELRYAYGQVPAHDEVLEVAPGVYWVRMPLEITGLDHVNLWLLRDNTGWAIIDTGMNSEAIKRHWVTILRRYGEGRPLKRVLCTHFHPDHMGLAGWFEAETGCHLMATRLEWLYGRMLSLDAEEGVPGYVRAHYDKVGFQGDDFKALADFGHNPYRQMVTTVPAHYVRLEERDVVSIGDHEWWVIVGTGHAPEHACLYSRELNVLISGDQFLPRISPHIGVYPAEAEANPLRDYLESNERFRMLPEDVLVLPAHNEPFHGLHARIDQLAAHHEERLSALDEALADSKTVLETLPTLFRRELRRHERVLGVGEALAHLNCLVQEGRVMREIGPDGVWRFRRTGISA